MILVIDNYDSFTYNLVQYFGELGADLVIRRNVFGGEVVRADRLMHGKTSPILHEGDGVFAGLPNPFEATRYHSLIVRRQSLPPELEITAETAAHEIMGLRHRRYPIEGVQFHPESILTEPGKRLLANFLGKR
jgi:anthranilate synthase/aminodeoxychorismate synthase-like glutamine amidotransferase